MIFKNLAVYTFTGTVNPIDLMSHLDSMPFKHCKPSQDFRAGFAKIYGTEMRLLSANDCHLFCLKSEHKKIPPKVVNTKLRKVIEAKEISYGRKLTKDERDDAKDQVYHSLVLDAENFAQTKEIWGYFDTAANLLVINCSSPKDAANLAEMLRPVISTKSVAPLKPQHDVSKRMTFWLSESQVPTPFTPGVKCAITDDTGTLKYNQMPLNDNRLIGYLKDGMRITSMALRLGDTSTFTLSQDFMITWFSINDSAYENADYGTGEPLEMLAGDLGLMTGEIRKVVTALMDSLGGEAPQDTEE